MVQLWAIWKFLRSWLFSLGVYYFAESERTYEGTFSQNLFEGKGKLTYKDGKCYEGDFVQGKKHGNGTMVFSNGNKYIGQWANDWQHGVGIYFTAKTGEKRQGQWVNNKRTNWLSNAIKVKGKWATVAAAAPAHVRQPAAAAVATATALIWIQGVWPQRRDKKTSWTLPHARSLTSIWLTDYITRGENSVWL